MCLDIQSNTAHKKPIEPTREHGSVVQAEERRRQAGRSRSKKFKEEKAESGGKRRGEKVLDF
jgi:hypothetical protein